MTEQIVFTNEAGEEVRFFVEEQTMLAGINYLLVTDGEGEEADAYILKCMGENGEDGEIVYEMVEDEQELDAISKVFTELLEDVSIEVQE